MKSLFLTVMLLILSISLFAQVSFTVSINISREGWRDSTLLFGLFIFHLEVPIKGISNATNKQLINLSATDGS